MTSFTYPEGATPLNPDETEGLRHKHITTRSELDHLEQANIVDGLRWLEKYSSTDLLSQEFVKELHAQLFGEVWQWAGKFRTTEKNIGVEPSHIPVQLRILLDDLRFWLEHQTYGAAEAALRFHHRLVFIHLFPNGNGRHARIMADAVLTKICKVAPIDWSRGQELQVPNERRREYINALRAADRGDVMPLLRFGGV